jgi:hypothetical protein
MSKVPVPNSSFIQLAKISVLILTKTKNLVLKMETSQSSLKQSFLICLCICMSPTKNTSTLSLCLLKKFVEFIFRLLNCRFREARNEFTKFPLTCASLAGFVSLEHRGEASGWHTRARSTVAPAAAEQRQHLSRH